MNRVIKFRAWDGQNKEMISAWDDGAFFLTSEGVPYDIFKRTKLPWKLMQFTGLTDKNGKEIYEGDVVRVKAHSDWYEPIKTKGYADIKVEWYEKSAGFWPFIHDYRALGMKKYYMSNDDVIDCEVIGNVYENPELLTK